MVSRRVEPQLFEFKVLIRRKGFKEECPYNFLAAGIEDLFDMLWKNDGLSPDDIDDLVIHQINPDGTVTELVDHHKDHKQVAKIYEFPGGKQINTTGDETIDNLVEIMEEVRKENATYTRELVKVNVDSPKKQGGILGGFSYWSYPAVSVEE